jgi:hypothetical protein
MRKDNISRLDPLMHTNEGNYEYEMQFLWEQKF